MLLGGLLLLGNQIAPLFTSVPQFTHTRKWGLRPKYTSAVHVHTPSLLRHFLHQEARWQSHTPIRPHSSAAEYTLNAARMRLCARRNRAECGSEEAFRLLLLIGNDLKLSPHQIELQGDNLYLQIRLCQECKKRHLLEQLRAINEHDESAPAAFRFLYSTLTKHMDAYSSSSLL